MRPINKPDISNTSRKYWDKVLSSLGLSKDRGKAPQFWLNRGSVDERKVRQALNVGGATNIAGIEEEQARKQSGRVIPPGHGPDS